MTPAEFAAAVPVSRETLDRLTAYLDLLRQWNQRIKLVGPGSMRDPWCRHILDSAQLLPLIPAGSRGLLDLGSGAGLPGLVLAILGARNVHLVEADQRKAAFLREAARITGAAVTIHACRIESVGLLDIDVVTARALCSLTELLSHASLYRRNDLVCLFLKGASLDEELTVARQQWNIRFTKVPSRSSADGTILVVEGFEHGSDGRTR